MFCFVIRREIRILRAISIFLLCIKIHLIHKLQIIKLKLTNVISAFGSRFVFVVE